MTDNNKEMLRQDYIRMARRWRLSREKYIVVGSDNEIELADFESELTEYFFPPILRLAANKIITDREAHQWCADIHNEWVILTLYSRGGWRHKFIRWLYHG